MRHEDAGLSLWLATDDASRDREIDCYKPARRAEAGAARSVRRRVGGAFIALGERLAGEPRPVARRRLATRAS